MKGFVTCKIPVSTRNTSEMYEDMGIENPTKEYVDFSFKPEHVTAYRKDLSEDGSSVTGTVFSLPNDEYYTEMKVAEFERLISEQDEPNHRQP